MFSRKKRIHEMNEQKQVKKIKEKHKWVCLKELLEIECVFNIFLDE